MRTSILCLAALSALSFAAIPTLAAAVQRGRPAAPPRAAPDGPAAQRRAPTGRVAPTPGGAGTRSQDEEDVAARYFELCDADANGWISYREARDSLGLAGPEAFGVFDGDSDGMCELPEFRARYDAVLARGGAFPPPRNARPNDLGDGSRAAVLGLYDQDLDQRLDEHEVESALKARDVRDADLAALLEELDGDGSGLLEGREIERFGAQLESQLKSFRAGAPKSLEDLFGRPEPRVEDALGFVHEPPLIPGPVDPFRRLDLDGDGGITRADLEDLERPLKPPVRLETLMATLDRDGDGRISRAELRGSMERSGQPAAAAPASVPPPRRPRDGGEGSRPADAPR